MTKVVPILAIVALAAAAVAARSVGGAHVSPATGSAPARTTAPFDAVIADELQAPFALGEVKSYSCQS